MRQYIRDATIVNGDGYTPPFLGDVLIENDRIVGLGSIPHSDVNAADRKLDAAQLKPLDGAIDAEWSRSTVAEFLPGIAGVRSPIWASIWGIRPCVAW
jgi:hypothetical protein